MPSIEITKEQAEALARGENVVLTAPKPKHHVAVHKNAGSIYLTRGPLSNAAWRLLHPGNVSFVSYGRYSEWDVDRSRENFTTDSYATMPVENA